MSGATTAVPPLFRSLVLFGSLVKVYSPPGLVPWYVLGKLAIMNFELMRVFNVDRAK